MTTQTTSAPLFLVFPTAIDGRLSAKHSWPAQDLFCGETYEAGRDMARTFPGSAWALLTIPWGVVLPLVPLKPGVPELDGPKALGYVGYRFGSEAGWARVVVDTLAQEFALPDVIRPVVVYAPGMPETIRVELDKALESASWLLRLKLFDGMDSTEARVIALHSLELSALGLDFGDFRESLRLRQASKDVQAPLRSAGRDDGSSIGSSMFGGSD